MTSAVTLPGPRGHWLWGALPRLRHDILGFFEDCFREYGDAVYFRVANRRAMLLSHPEDIEQVLVAENRHFVKNYAMRFLRPLLGRGLLLNEGPDWLRQRRLIQPAFTRPKVEGYVPAMVECTRQMLARWQAGCAVDFSAAMLRLTMTIGGRTLLGIDAGSHFREVVQCLQTVLDDFLQRLGRPLVLPPWVPTPGNLRLRRAIRHLDQILQQLIERRRREQAGDDALSLLVRARDEVDGGGLSDRQLRDEVMTLFLAGHETTANALTWTWHLLSQHPDVQAEVRREARDVLGEADPTAADLARLKFTECVVREALRLYPPAYVIGRRPLVDLTIGRHCIPAGTNVLMSQWIVHRDPRWFDDPLRFTPQRWADGLASRIPKYAYFPFGGGPRVCIGNTFAMVEAVLVTAMIAQRFVLTPVQAEAVPLLPAVTLRPAVPILLTVKPGHGAGVT
jgi:cytochrome P450